MPAASVSIPALKMEKGKGFHQALGPTVPENTYCSLEEGKEGTVPFPNSCC